MPRFALNAKYPTMQQRKQKENNSMAAMEAHAEKRVDFGNGRCNTLFYERCNR